MAKQNACPTCNGGGQIKTPDGSLWQPCWKCDGSGDDPGIEVFTTLTFKGTIPASQTLLQQRIVNGSGTLIRIKMLTRFKTGDFRIRLFDSDGNYYSSSGIAGASTNDRVRDACIFGDGQLPFLVVPFLMIPNGGFIGFDLEDVSGANNPIELNFHGAKVRPTPSQQ
jgi:hypothetical protein